MGYPYNKISAPMTSKTLDIIPINSANPSTCRRYCFLTRRPHINQGKIVAISRIHHCQVNKLSCHEANIDSQSPLIHVELFVHHHKRAGSQL